MSHKNFKKITILYSKFYYRHEKNRPNRRVKRLTLESSIDMNAESDCKKLL